MLLPPRRSVPPDVVASAIRAVESQVREGSVDVVVAFPSPGSWGLRMLSSVSSTRSTLSPLGDGSNVGENWYSIVWEAWASLWRACLDRPVGLVILSSPGVNFFDSFFGSSFKYHHSFEWGVLHSCASGVALAEGPIESRRRVLVSSNLVASRRLRRKCVCGTCGFWVLWSNILAHRRGRAWSWRGQKLSQGGRGEDGVGGVHTAIHEPVDVVVLCAHQRSHVLE